MSRYIILLTILFSTFFSYSQQQATTTDGKTVILNADGTWTSVPQIDNTSIPKHAELPKAKSQDIIINHLAYTLSYNTTYNIANWVAYELTAEETIATVKRDDHFAPDPLLHSNTVSNTDYKGSGYDKGHLAPAADMCFSSQSMIESFYLTNMSPQDPSFNRGIWSRLEKQVRQWAVDDNKIYVVTGTILTKGLSTIGFNRIAVPKYFYKVILDYTEPEIKGIAFILPNTASKETLQHYVVTIDSLEKVTGIDFFYQISESKQSVFESAIDLKKWSWTTNSTTAVDKEKASTSSQCKGLTKAGAQCKNKTLNTNGYCHLHQSQLSGVEKQDNTVQISSPKRSSTVRCSATTKKGTQCSRMTFSANGKCWQHGGD